jgi:hypothetical protein
MKSAAVLSTPGRRQQVSTDGGTAPAWSRDGRELFFTATQTTGGQATFTNMIAVRSGCARDSRRARRACSVKAGTVPLRPSRLRRDAGWAAVPDGPAEGTTRRASRRSLRATPTGSCRHFRTDRPHEAASIDNLERSGLPLGVVRLRLSVMPAPRADRMTLARALNALTAAVTEVTILDFVGVLW